MHGGGQCQCRSGRQCQAGTVTARSKTETPLAVIIFGMDRQHSASTMEAIALSLVPEFAGAEQTFDDLPSDASLPPLDLSALSALPSRQSSAATPAAAADASSGSQRKRRNDGNTTEAPAKKWSRQSTNDAIALSLEPQPGQQEQLDDKATLSFLNSGVFQTPVLEWTRDCHQWIKAKEAVDPVLGYYRKVPVAVQEVIPPLLQRMHSKRTQEAVDLSLQLAGESVAAQLEGTVRTQATSHRNLISGEVFDDCLWSQWTDWKQLDASFLTVPTYMIIICRRPGEAAAEMLFDVFKVTLDSDTGECERLILKCVDGDRPGVQVIRGGSAAEGGLQRLSSMASRAKRNEFLEKQRPLFEKRPAGQMVNVPGTGACLFHAIEQSSDVSVAHRLRMAVIGWVKEHWGANSDIAPLLGAARRDIQWNPDEKKFEPLYLREQLADFPGDDGTLEVRMFRTHHCFPGSVCSLVLLLWHRPMCNTWESLERERYPFDVYSTRSGFDSISSFNLQVCAGKRRRGYRCGFARIYTQRLGRWAPQSARFRTARGRFLGGTGDAEEV